MITENPHLDLQWTVIGLPHSTQLIDILLLLAIGLITGLAVLLAGGPLTPNLEDRHIVIQDTLIFTTRKIVDLGRQGIPLMAIPPIIRLRADTALLYLKIPSTPEVLDPMTHDAKK